MNDAYIDGECTKPKTNKRLKMIQVDTNNSNCENSATDPIAKYLIIDLIVSLQFNPLNKKVSNLSV